MKGLFTPVPDGRYEVRFSAVDERRNSVATYVCSAAPTPGGPSRRVNVTVQVPRSGPYDLTLTANHQRIAVRELDVRGVLEGYGSPGADIDAGLDGDLSVRLSGVSYQSRFAEVDNVQGGTTV